MPYAGVAGRERAWLGCGLDNQAAVQHAMAAAAAGARWDIIGCVLFQI